MDKDVTIRPYQSGDDIAFRQLNQEWITRYFRLEPKDKEVLGNPHGAIIQAGGHILMAVSGDESIGCCALVPHGVDCFEVSKMAVTESYQAKGVGRRLMTAIISLARKLGAKRLYLETNTVLGPAVRLYESLGFQHMPPEQVAQSPFERADVFMELLLGN
jgi:putative acetyltransferase